jgi:hypothetical protein
MFHPNLASIDLDSKVLKPSQTGLLKSHEMPVLEEPRPNNIFFSPSSSISLQINTYKTIKETMPFNSKLGSPTVP